MLLLAASGIFIGPASASVINVGPDAFGPDSFRIGFDGLSPGTVNPVYLPPPGAPADATVAFGGYFTGQHMGGVDGCAAAFCVEGTPEAGLSLDRNGLPAVVTTDIDAPSNPVLSGDPLFTGPISILFGQGQTGVGLLAGAARASGSERLTAFDRDGNTLATTVNEGTGYTLLALASNDGSREIAGVQLVSTGLTGFGFALDSVVFGGPDQVTVESSAPSNPPAADVPGPANLGLFGLALALTGLLARRRRRRTMTAAA